MSIVVCKLPKAGLGNQLFPLMHAFLFGHLNGLPVIVTNYHQLKPGPYLRREKSKRNYKGYFTFQKSIVGEFIDRIKIKMLSSKYAVVHEPEIGKLYPDDLKKKLFLFERMPTYHDYFVNLKDYRHEIYQLLYSKLNPAIRKKIEQAERPAIGAHIRMGDFRKLESGESYNGGHVRMPEHYFVNTINAIRKINGKDLPVSVFTDGREGEFHDLLKITNINIVKGNPDIVDLLLLSKSGIIILTHGSTFSVWAAFLSDAPVLCYADYPQTLRPRAMGTEVYEGTFQWDNKLLIDSIKSVG